MKVYLYAFQLLAALQAFLHRTTANAPSDGSSFRREKRWVFGGPPQFHPDSPGNVTAQLGGSAYLPCRIKNLGNKSVSWVRRRDTHILTVDRYTFIADERFVAWHDRATRSWTLMVKYVQERDAGIYECQVSTEPKMSLFVHLSVIKPKVDISNEQDLYVKQGSRVTINCTIKNSIEVPQYIFWYHDNDRIVSEHSTRRMRVRKVPPQTTVGSYAIESATLADSGNYTCEPAGLENATVTLHVLAGEEPAAMQHGVNSSPALWCHWPALLLTLWQPSVSLMARVIRTSRDIVALLIRTPLIH